MVGDASHAPQPHEPHRMGGIPRPLLFLGNINDAGGGLTYHNFSFVRGNIHFCCNYWCFGSGNPYNSCFVSLFKTLQNMLWNTYPIWCLGCVFPNRAQNTNFGIVKTNSSAPRELNSGKLGMLVSPLQYWWFEVRIWHLFTKLRRCYVLKHKW